MPVKVPNKLPAVAALRLENVFVMTDERAASQDIRPLRVAVINLMPTKEATETQLLRLLGNTPLQVEVYFLHMGSHESKNTDRQHLDMFYLTFDDVLRQGLRFDAMVVTGAPVEKIDYEDVDYWGELTRLMCWADKNVFSTMYICWAALAGLKWHYGIEKQVLDKKIVGVFPHRVLDARHPLVRCFDDVFYAPHSRYGTVCHEDVYAAKGLRVLAESEEAGVYLMCSIDGRQVYVTGHCEYDRDTLLHEYTRDIGKGITDAFPVNYFPDDDPSKTPRMLWRGHAGLLWANWLNYMVYQNTPYDLGELR
ncbi:MAG: homoserine O-succinyltransferase [Clostridia bacterium]|nr:homoserine O-succinyltransferase [Clostridia bacterium]